MRGINYLAGLGTVLIIGGIYCFKALFPKKLTREGLPLDNKPLSGKIKLLLVLAGIVLVVLGAGMILRALKLI